MDLYEDHLAINVGGATPNPSIQVSGPASGAVGANLVFSAAADDCRGVSDGWTWTSDGGAGSSTNASLTVSWASPGAKTVTATNSGCIGVTGMTTVTIVSGNEIFADGFESGDTTAWSATDAP